MLLRYFTVSSFPGFTRNCGAFSYFDRWLLSGRV